MILPEQKIAAVSFLSGNDRQLRELIESAEGAEEVQGRIKGHDGWMLVQVMEGERPVTHVMIDAGMTRSKAKSLAVDVAGIKLVFSGQKDRPAGEGPFSSRTRWQPVFIAELNAKKVSRETDFEPPLVLGT